LVAPIFIAIVLATLQISIIFFVKSYLETGAEEGARLVLTNRAIATANGVTSPMSQSQFKAAICAQFNTVFSCGSLIVQLQPLPNEVTSIASLMPTFKADGTLAKGTTYSPGGGGQNMLLTVEYPWPIFGGPLGLNFATQGNGTLLMTSTQIFRVES